MAKCVALGSRGRRSDEGYDKQVSMGPDVTHLAKDVYFKCSEYVQYDQGGPDEKLQVPKSSINVRINITSIRWQGLIQQRTHGYMVPKSCSMSSCSSNKCFWGVAWTQRQKQAVSSLIYWGGMRTGTCYDICRQPGVSRTHILHFQTPLEVRKLICMQMSSVAGSGQMEGQGGKTEIQGRLVTATWSVTSTNTYHNRHIKHIQNV